MKRMLITGSVMPSEHDRGEQLAKSVRMKPSELVAIGYTKVLDEIERTGCVMIKTQECEEGVEWPPRVPKNRRRGHALFDN